MNINKMPGSSQSPASLSIGISLFLRYKDCIQDNTTKVALLKLTSKYIIML